VHRIGPSPVLQSQPGVGFRPRDASLNHGHCQCCCFSTAAHRLTDRSLRLSPEAAFTATPSTPTRCRSLTSEPTPSATPPTCHQWSPSARTHCRGWPIPRETEGAQSHHRTSALPTPTPFTGESLAPRTVFQPPPLAAASHLTGRFSIGLEPREAVICWNRLRRR
jgi:hypothetical protein